MLKHPFQDHPKRTILLSSVHKMHHFSLGQPVPLFMQQWDFAGADSLASHRRLLIVTVPTGSFRPSLISLELNTGRVYVTLAFLQSVPTVVFRFLPRLSGFGCYFKASFWLLFEIIFCTSSYVFSSPISFFIKVCCSSEQCLAPPILLRFSEACTITSVYNSCCLCP